jgi:hypothetical protein
MRLVFVHGMRQEHKNAAELREVWEIALTTAWTAAGLARPQYTLEMPYYGDVLNTLTQEVRGSSVGVLARGQGGPGTFTPFEEALIRQMGAKEGITDAEVRAELGQEVVARGPANWEWVQALGRLLERNVPGVGNVGLAFVHQVDAYLTRPHIQAAVDAIVRPQLVGGPVVVVAHSLGTIVSYRLLRQAGNATKAPLFVTLGSPLGIDVVKQHLKPPILKVPDGVAKWLNGTDERDYVALHARLDHDTFADEIENASDIHNRQSDAHAIVDYLANTTISKRIGAALANT